MRIPTHVAVFYPPPGLRTFSYEAFCVDFGNECVAPNVGTGVAGVYNNGINAASVTGLTPNTTYSCFVATITKIGAVCSKPTYVYTNL